MSQHVWQYNGRRALRPAVQWTLCFGAGTVPAQTPLPRLFAYAMHQSTVLPWVKERHHIHEAPLICLGSDGTQTSLST